MPAGIVHSPCKNKIGIKELMAARLTAIILLLTSLTASADFGDYEDHALLGQSLLVETTMGSLRVTAVDDAAFYVHYVEDGVAQLPSFALAGIPDPQATALTANEDSIELVIDGLTATVTRSPVTVSFSRNGEPLVTEEHGYFNTETLRGFRFRLNDDEKIMGGRR